MKEVLVVKSIKKALDILDIFLKKETELQLIEIAELAGQNKPTTYRILQPLLEYGYVYQKEKRGKYGLGTKWLDFASVIKENIVFSKVAIPYMEDLEREVDETVLLNINQNYKVSPIEIIPAKHIIKIEPDTKKPNILYSTATGKIYLAFMKKHELQSYLDTVTFQALTYNTIRDLDQLKAELNTVRKTNIAYDNEEANLEVRGIASGIFDHEKNNVGSVCMIGPINRLTREKMSSLAPIIKKYALEISQKLGFKET